MGRLAYTGLWFITISIIVSLLFPDQPLGYLWILIVGLSIFFGHNTGKKLIVPEDASRQMETWIKKYQRLSYYQRQLFLNDLVKRALMTNQTKEVEKFLNFIINSEPDNEIVKGLLVSIWGTEITRKNQQAEIV